MSESLLELVNEINQTRSQTSASAKDEVRVMKAMLNDPTYTVDIYSKDGVVAQYSPYNSARSLVSNIIKDTAKISGKEADELASNYKFGKSEASTMIDLSKEFVNVYMDTGRKLPLGAREKSNISLSRKVKESHPNTYPKKIGTDSNGKDIYETVTDGMIPEFNSVKVYAPCPDWLLNK